MKYYERKLFTEKFKKADDRLKKARITALGLRMNILRQRDALILAYTDDQDRVYFYCTDEQWRRLQNVESLTL